jgi:ubiquinone/menaquinone biosynthesis C-methylase UbiE
MENKITYSDHIKHYITDAQVSDYFSPGEAEKQSIRRRYELFKSLLSLKDNDMFCEVGSGGGQALEIIKKSKVSYYPVDLSQKNLKTIANDAQSMVFPAFADIYALPFKDNSFNKMVVSEVLEHLENPGQALAEIYRVLKADGIALISVPNNEKITYHLCVHCNQTTPANAHLHSFDKHKLATVSESAGFTIRKSVTFGNKLAQLMNLNSFLKTMPFFIWRLSEFIFNILIPKKSHLLLILVKNN